LPAIRISSEQPTIEVAPADTVHIASGGQSSVYKLGPECVLRELSTQPGSPEYLQEMEIARSFSGRHIDGVANVLDVGEGYVVMERAPGIPLSQVIGRYPDGVPPRLAAQIVQKVALALESLNNAGLVHRDIKPDNIMVETGPNGELRSVKLIDLFTSAKSSVTGPYDGVLRAGTPTYASPEQLAGGGVTGKSDVYSLGKVFYRMLTGNRLFHDHRDGIVRATLEENITIEHPAMQKIPAWLRGRLIGMLSPSPAIRPSARNLELSLESDLTLNPETPKVISPEAESATVNEPDVTVRELPGNGRSSGRPLVPDEATVNNLPTAKPSAPESVGRSTPSGGRPPISFRGLGVGLGGTALGLGVGYGVHYGLGQAGVKSEGVKAVASIGAGHFAGVGFNRLMTGKMPGAGAQVRGLALGLGGAFFAGDCYNSLLNSSGVDSHSMARSAPAQATVGIGGGVAFTAAGTVALPFAAVAIANEIPKYVYSHEDYAVKQSEVDLARENMRKIYENGSGLESAVALTSLTMSFVPIFDGLLTLASDATSADTKAKQSEVDIARAEMRKTYENGSGLDSALALGALTLTFVPGVDRLLTLGSDATASSVKPTTIDTPSSPDRLTRAERAALAAAQSQAPRRPVNPLPYRPMFIPSLTPSMATMSSRF
jgi:serine/threonine protein kinase